MKVKLLGTVQDGGVPHMGCSCELCESARKNCKNRMYVAALMLKECGEEYSTRYLIDATPDIRYQIGGGMLDGVFLSHGHLGHIAGLPFFGRESMDTDNLSVYCTADMKEYIMNNEPFKLLAERGHIRLHETRDGERIKIISKSKSESGFESGSGSGSGSVEFRQVAHRCLNTDTVSFMIRGSKRTLYYLSDIDEWTENALDNVRAADIAIVDGTFYDRDEIDRYDEVPHPCIRKTIELTEDFETDIKFTHLNHTNPALRKDSQERREIQNRGFQVVKTGMEITL